MEPNRTLQHSMQTFSNPVSFKLDEENLLPWKQQALATINGYDLSRFITTNIPIPNSGDASIANKSGESTEDKTDTATSGVTTQKTTSSDAIQKAASDAQQDQLLLSWLLSSMSETLYTRMVGCLNSYQVWCKLEEFFASHTRAKAKQLKLQLKNIKKEGDVSKYLLQIKKIIDSLAAVGSPISTEDHINAIFDGLNEDYDSFVTSVTSRIDPYSVGEIEALLMAQEQRIQKHHKNTAAAIDLNFTQTQFRRPATNRGGVFNQNRGRFSNYRVTNTCQWLCDYY